MASDKAPQAPVEDYRSIADIYRGIDELFSQVSAVQNYNSAVQNYNYEAALDFSIQAERLRNIAALADSLADDLAGVYAVLN